jgi:hypothetical protein
MMARKIARKGNRDREKDIERRRTETERKTDRCSTVSKRGRRKRWQKK